MFEKLLLARTVIRKIKLFKTFEDIALWQHFFILKNT